jgi:hypothetical protein
MKQKTTWTMMCNQWQHANCPCCEHRFPSQKAWNSYKQLVGRLEESTAYWLLKIGKVGIDHYTEVIDRFMRLDANQKNLYMTKLREALNGY